MVFTRSIPVVEYADYTKYRLLLRVDFQYRCAYCLRHEGHNGGEANFCIDHFQCVNGLYGRPDLQSIYTNLYYACCECNENKADCWPTQEQIARGYRFLDPCQPGDDHNLHWRFVEDGSLEPLTSVGRYTMAILVLWRPQLQYWRRRMFMLERMAERMEALLSQKQESAEREELQSELDRIKQEIEPPIFDRPRGLERRRVGDLFVNDPI